MKREKTVEFERFETVRKRLVCRHSNSTEENLKTSWCIRAEYHWNKPNRGTENKTHNKQWREGMFALLNWAPLVWESKTEGVQGIKNMGWRENWSKVNIMQNAVIRLFDAQVDQSPSSLLIDFHTNCANTAHNNNNNGRQTDVHIYDARVEFLFPFSSFLPLSFSS